MTGKKASTKIDWAKLRQAADAVRKYSHSPYSHYPVGAALLADDGRIFVATNVENASYPLSLCAERGAVASALAAGAKRFVAIAIVSKGPVPAPPCGGCRQVLSEFPPSFEVRCYAPRGRELRSTVAKLLPFAFDGEFLK